MELFAGEGNVFSAVKSQGYGGVAADIEYAKYFPDLLEGCKTNPFDILSTSGLAYLGSALLYILICLQFTEATIFNEFGFCFPNLFEHIFGCPLIFKQPNNFTPALHTMHHEGQFETNI